MFNISEKFVIIAPRLREMGELRKVSSAYLLPQLRDSRRKGANDGFGFDQIELVSL